MKPFILGLFVGWIALIVAAYLFVVAGGMPVTTSAPPLPFEEFIARTALRAAYRGSKNLKPPIEPTEENLMEGAKLYKNECSYCHGTPDVSKGAANVTFFPPPPLLYKHDMSKDPVGETFLKIKDGIRLSAMPSFSKAYSDEKLWQVALLLSRGNDLPAKVKEELLK